MRKLYRTAIMIIMTLGFLATILCATQQSFAASRSSRSKRYSLTEKWVLQQIKKGETANLKEKYGEGDEKRKISHTFIMALLTGDVPSKEIHRHGVDIKNAIITGKIDLISAEVPFEVKFKSCVFKNNLDLQDSHFKRSLQFNGSKFEGAASFLRMKVDGNAYFNTTIFKGKADFERATIGKEFSAMNAKFQPKIQSKIQPSIFKSLKTGMNALFNGCTFGGKVNFRRADIGGVLILEDVTFEKNAKFDYAKVGADANIIHAKFHEGGSFTRVEIKENLYAEWVTFFGETKKISFSGLKVGHLARFQNAIFEGPVNFNNADIAFEFQAKNAQFKKGLESSGLKVGVIANFEDAIFGGPVDKEPAIFTGLTVGQLVKFTDTIFNGPVDFSGSKCIGAKLLAAKEGTVLERGYFKGEVSLKCAHLSDLIIKGKGTHDNERLNISILNLEDTLVERELTIENVKLSKLKAYNLQGKGQTTFNKMKISSEVDLRDATFSNIKVLQREKDWPQGKDKVQLSGMTYKVISPTEKSATRKDWDRIITLINNSGFDSRNYLQLQNYLARAGDEDLSDEVFIAMKNRELWEYPSLCNIPGNILKYFFWGLLAGYGRKPFRPLICGLVLVVIGAIFVFNPKSLDINYIKKWPWITKYDSIRSLRDILNCIIDGTFFKSIMDRNFYKYYTLKFILSFDQFIPAIDLGLANSWKPQEISFFAWIWWYIQKFAGWVLIPIATAAIYTQFK